MVLSFYQGPSHILQTVANTAANLGFVVFHLVCFVFLCLTWGAGPPCLCHDKPCGIFALEDPPFLTNLPLPREGKQPVNFWFSGCISPGEETQRIPKELTQCIGNTRSQSWVTTTPLEEGTPGGCRTPPAVQEPSRAQCWQTAQAPRQGDPQTGRTKPQICSCQMKWKYWQLDFLQWAKQGPAKLEAFSSYPRSAYQQV